MANGRVQTHKVRGGDGMKFITGPIALWPIHVTLDQSFNRIPVTSLTNLSCIFEYYTVGSGLRLVLQLDVDPLGAQATRQRIVVGMPFAAGACVNKSIVTNLSET